MRSVLKPGVRRKLKRIFKNEDAGPQVKGARNTEDYFDKWYSLIWTQAKDPQICRQIFP